SSAHIEVSNFHKYLRHDHNEPVQASTFRRSICRALGLWPQTGAMLWPGLRLCSNGFFSPSSSSLHHDLHSAVPFPRLTLAWEVLGWSGNQPGKVEEDSCFQGSFCRGWEGAQEKAAWEGAWEVVPARKAQGAWKASMAARGIVRVPPRHL
ncbi:MAG: hypothetical protein ACPIOQ_16100, partial [Promethearchaeia archaeon]